MATARTMDLRPLRRNDHDRAGMIWEAKPGTANENGCQQDVPPYAAQGAPKVNFNVGQNIWRTNEDHRFRDLHILCMHLR